MVYDSARGVVVLFGGSYWVVVAGQWNYVQSNQTWEWNGSSWSQMAPVTSPPARAGAFISFDTSVNKVVLFGGRDASWTTLGDTWTWDGANWTLEHPAASPSPRAYGGMVYDAALSQSVIYGGASSHTSGAWLADTWLWYSAGHVWTRLQAASAPGPRVDVQLGYDPALAQVVMFGGSVSSCTPGCISTVVGDTWTLSGTTWSGQTPMSSPSPRVLYRLAYDPVAAGVVLFAGETSDPGSVLHDTWRWNGSAWQQATGISSPPGRELFGMAYDSAAGQMVVVGGDGALTVPTDTWTYNWGVPTLRVTTDASTYGHGGQVAYTTLVGNAGPSSMTASMTVVLDPGLSLGGLLQPSFVDNVTGAPAGACSPAGGAIVCQKLSDTSLLLSNLSLAAGQVLRVVYQATALASAVLCSALNTVGQAWSALGLGIKVTVPVGVCSGGLGLESWWSYATQDLGAGGTASVNVANGNLVVQQVDSTPVQGHGRLGYVLRRTYNSADSTLVTLGGSIGAGWQFNVSQTGDLAGLGVTPIGLSVPSLMSLLNPLSVTLIDRDGTHHVYSFNALATNLVAPATNSVNGGGVTTLLDSLLAFAPAAVRQAVKTLCLDTSYTPPPGVHLDLWRYIGVPGASCANPGATGQEAVLGFSAVRPDRVRYDFSTSGQTVDMVDGSGNAQLYRYDSAGRLSSIAEAACAAGTACRSTALSYAVANEVDVTDVAGRLTRYVTDGANPAHLVKVVNPDGSNETYSYGGCGGTANQLCSATDPRGQTTAFTYTAALLGPGPLATMVDRRKKMTATFTYSAGRTLLDRGDTGVACAGKAGCERAKYQGIDLAGRVGELDEGNSADSFYRVTKNTWDAYGSTGCTNPAPAGGLPGSPVDNELCSQSRWAIGYAPDSSTTWSYGAEGQTLSQHQVVAAGQAVDTTWGYHIQYVEANGTVNCFDDTPVGRGLLSVGTPACHARRDGSTLYALADKTAMVTPRGNAASGTNAYQPFQTTYTVDDTAGLPNQAQAAGSCGAAPAANTGNVCQVDAPATNGTATAPGGTGQTTTRYGYDNYGQKTTMTSPKALAEGGGSYRYSYYQDGDRDLSGSVTAGGWLKAVTDPTGNFVSYGYDRAGNQVRTWDRDATAGHQITDSWAAVASPPSPAYTETVYGPYPGAPAGATAYSAPWRWPLSSRDPLANLTSYTLDADGNRAAIRPPRGNQAANNTFDVTQGYDADGNLTWALQPLEAGPTGPPSPPPTTPTPPPAQATIYGYDTFGNRISQTDPQPDPLTPSSVQTWAFDSVNRPITHTFTQGPFVAATKPPACKASTTADTPIPAGRLLCSTAIYYNGVNDVYATSDGNAQVTVDYYDALGRKTSQSVPRAAGPPVTYVTTAWNYDADGNKVDTCPPREFTEGANTCTATGVYSAHVAFNAAGLAVATTTYRQAGSTLTTTTGYDADANPTTVTDANNNPTTTKYNVLDRKVEIDKPRAGNVTTFGYDPAGNLLTRVDPPDSQNQVHQSAYSYDAANRPLDTVTGADNPTAAAAGRPDNAGGRNVRTRVGYDPDGHAVASYQPNAFVPYTDTNGVNVADPRLNPNPDYLTVTGYDNNGRPTTSQTPRYDTGPASPATPLTGDTTQTGQCPTGVAGYPATTGVCTTTTRYDHAGRVTEIDPPTVNTSTNSNLQYAYTDNGLLAAVNTPDPTTTGARVANQVSYNYDGDGKQVSRTDTLGAQTVTAYTPDELVAATGGPNYGTVTHVTGYAYDANGNQIETADAAGQVTTTSYTPDNLKSATCRSLTANKLCNLTANPPIDGLQTAYSYDPAGNPLTVTSPAASASAAATTPAGKDPTNPSATPTANTYTADNLLATTTVPIATVTNPGTPPTYTVTSWRQTAYGYDPAGRKTAQETTQTTTAAPLAAPTPQMCAAPTRDLNTQCFTYSPAGRPQTESGRGGTDTIAHSYNPDGQPTNYHAAGGDAAADVTATYYLDQTVRNVDDTGRTTSYAYDGVNNITARTETTDGTATSHSTSYTYNAAALPASQTSDLTGGTLTPWQFGYDKTGRPTNQTDPNGQTVTTRYNPDGTVNDQTTANAAGISLADWQYVYDNATRVTTQTLQNAQGVIGSGNLTVAGTDTYRYDPAGRLTSYADQNGTRTLTWDHDSNRTNYGLTGDTYTAPSGQQKTVPMTYNADDTINTGPVGTTNTTAGYTYDPTGRLNGDGCNTRHYDGLDRTNSIQANNLSGSCGPAGTVAYTYDGSGRQRSNTSADLHYDGTSQTVIAETPTGTANDTNYILSATGSPQALATPLPLVSYLTGDGHDNITTITTIAGLLTCAARFDPYGNPENPNNTDPQKTCNSGTTTNTAFYHAAHHDTATGTYQFGNRTYDPAKAAFTTADNNGAGPSGANLSIGVDPLTRNTYTYVNGDPVNFTDPSGHLPSECGPGPEHDRAVCDEWGARRSGGYALANWCGKSLGCSIADFNGLNFDQRKTWLRSFSQGTAQRYFNAGTWFAAISGVLNFVSDEHIGRPGSWFSWVDASILYGIEGGAALAKGSSVVETGIAGLGPSSDGGPGKWERFFRAVQHGGSSAALRKMWAEAEIDSTNFGVFHVAPKEGYASPRDDPLRFAAFAAGHQGEILAYAGSELFRRTNQDLGWDGPLLEAFSVILGGAAAAKGALGGAISGIGWGFSNCGEVGLFCAAGGLVGGAIGGAWHGLTEGRVQSFFDPRNSWGTYGGAHCLYDNTNNSAGAAACISGLIASH